MHGEKGKNYTTTQYSLYVSLPFLVSNHSLDRNEHALLTAKQLKGRSKARQSGIYHPSMKHE